MDAWHGRLVTIAKARVAGNLLVERWICSLRGLMVPALMVRVAVVGCR